MMKALVEMIRIVPLVGYKLINSSLRMHKFSPGHVLPAADSSWTTLDDYLDYVNVGHPDEEESDYCLNRIFESCSKNSFCDEIMAGNDPSFGYRATHKYYCKKSL